MKAHEGQTHTVYLLHIYRPPIERRSGRRILRGLAALRQQRQQTQRPRPA